jgi:predicted nucleic acid-binding Zn ribbon protein
MEDGSAGETIEVLQQMSDPPLTSASATLFVTILSALDIRKPFT